MGISRVDYGDNTLIDLTSDTVTEDTLVEGVTAHGADGNQIIGRMSPPVQADWDETNSESLSYIKNKPFGEGETVSLHIVATSSSGGSVTLDEEAFNTIYSQKDDLVVTGGPGTSSNPLHFDTDTNTITAATETGVTICYKGIKKIDPKFLPEGKGVRYVNSLSDIGTIDGDSGTVIVVGTSLNVNVNWRANGKELTSLPTCPYVLIYSGSEVLDRYYTLYDSDGGTWIVMCPYGQKDVYVYEPSNTMFDHIRHIKDLPLSEDGYLTFNSFDGLKPGVYYYEGSNDIVNELDSICINGLFTLIRNGDDRLIIVMPDGSSVDLSSDGNNYFYWSMTYADFIDVMNQVGMVEYDDETGEQIFSPTPLVKGIYDELGVLRSDEETGDEFVMRPVLTVDNNEPDENGNIDVSNILFQPTVESITLEATSSSGVDIYDLELATKIYEHPERLVSIHYLNSLSDFAVAVKEINTEDREVIFLYEYGNATRPFSVNATTGLISIGDPNGNGFGFILRIATPTDTVTRINEMIDDKMASGNSGITILDDLTVDSMRELEDGLYFCAVPIEFEFYDPNSGNMSSYTYSGVLYVVTIDGVKEFIFSDSHSWNVFTFNDEENRLERIDNFDELEAIGNFLGSSIIPQLPYLEFDENGDPVIGSNKTIKTNEDGVPQWVDADATQEFIFTVTKNVSDKTFSEIMAAYNSGYQIIGVYNGERYTLQSATSYAIVLVSVRFGNDSSGAKIMSVYGDNSINISDNLLPTINTPNRSGFVYYDNFNGISYLSDVNAPTDDHINDLIEAKKTKLDNYLIPAEDITRDNFGIEALVYEDTNKIAVKVYLGELPDNINQYTFILGNPNVINLSSLVVYHPSGSGKSIYVRAFSDVPSCLLNVEKWSDYKYAIRLNDYVHFIFTSDDDGVTWKRQSFSYAYKEDLQNYALTSDVPTDDHINDLIESKLQSLDGTEDTF